MRALVCPALGMPPQLTDRPAPVPGAGEVGLRIHACGLNFADLLMIEGRYQDGPPPPFVPGMELAGTVTALGEGAAGPPPGTRVAVFAGHGGLAEAGVFPAGRCLPIPDAMTWAEAAAFQIGHGTAHLALTRRARLRAGETLVVLGAAGGVGLAAVEVGHALGARVIAVARGADRLAVARAAGADAAIDGDTPELRAALRTLGGADVVFDAIGGVAFDAALRALRPEGRMVVIGFASGQVPQIAANHLLVKNIDVTGFYWGGYLRFAPDALYDSLNVLLGWHAEGRIRPHIGHVLPLARADEGLALLRDRRATGKVVITLD